MAFSEKEAKFTAKIANKAIFEQVLTNGQKLKNGQKINVIEVKSW
jgi:hypothetical protein